MSKNTPSKELIGAFTLACICHTTPTFSETVKRDIWNAFLDLYKSELKHHDDVSGSTLIKQLGANENVAKYIQRLCM